MDNIPELSLQPQLFYGGPVQTVSSLKTNSETHKQPVPFKLRRLLGPTSLWKVFKKQADALSFVNSRKCGLMNFVFQQNNGERLFLAAHPSWLWFHDSQKNPNSRSSFEIIPEFTVCKLYFDLEFSKDINPFHDGVEMLETFIKIVCFYLKKHWGIQCNRKNILDLDSSTNLKFSRHLIFQLPNAVFRDNYNAGNFVKYICKNIRVCIENLNTQNMCTSECLNFMKDCNIKAHQVKNLIVTNSKGSTATFCDEGVYTKNRHFRVFKSSKIGKQSPLVLSKENEYKLEANEEEIFLDSLITFIVDDIDGLKILQFQDDSIAENSSNGVAERKNVQLLNNIKTSPFPKIDNFIESLVHPGRIWRSFYFQASNLIVYDIVGNRYCGNIGRQHKSNNIKQIVDLSNACYYQKCYDPDCVGYKSVAMPLPFEVQFHIEDELDGELLLQVESESRSTEKLDDESQLLFDSQDNELSEILDNVEDISMMSVDSFSDNF